MTQVLGVNQSNPLSLNAVASPLAAASSLIHQASVTLTNDQILNLPTTPVEIVPAPGANAATKLITGLMGRPVFAANYTNVDPTAQGALKQGDGGNDISTYTQADFIHVLEDGADDPVAFDLNQDAQITNYRVEVDTSIALSAYNGSAGNFLDGDPENRWPLSLTFLVMDVDTGKFLTVAESGWNEATRQFYLPNYPQP